MRPGRPLADAAAVARRPNLGVSFSTSSTAAPCFAVSLSTTLPRRFLVADLRARVPTVGGISAAASAFAFRTTPPGSLLLVCAPPPACRAATDCLDDAGGAGAGVGAGKLAAAARLGLCLAGYPQSTFDPTLSIRDCFRSRGSGALLGHSCSIFITPEAIGLSSTSTVSIASVIPRNDRL
jgi:hypothetical protein